MIDLNSFMDKIKKMEKGEKLDLSSAEDLSIGIMNLIAIEEHLFFTANKTDDSKYYDMLDEVRQLRKGLMKKIVKENEGELWCTSKHLLSASMRLLEVGTKYLGKGQKKDAEDLFKKAYGLYSMFWMINLDKNNNIRENPLKIRENPSADEQINLIDEKENKEHKTLSVFEKAGDLVKRILDCCKE